MWIVDFGQEQTEAEASAYKKPFARIRKRVQPFRAKNKRDTYRELWWRMLKHDLECLLRSLHCRAFLQRSQCQSTGYSLKEAKAANVKKPKTQRAKHEEEML